MKQISGKELCKVLEVHEWDLKRVNGSHHIYAKSGNTSRLSVPVRGNKPLKKGLLNHLVKISGI